MKKLLSFLMPALMCAGAASAVTVTIHKTGGGPSGYERIKQEGPAEGPSTLDCWNPGPWGCNYVPIGPQPGGLAHLDINGAVTSQVESYILGGTLIGSYTEVTEGGAVEVSWSGTDIYNYVMTLDVK